MANPSKSNKLIFFELMIIRSNMSRQGDPQNDQNRSFSLQNFEKLFNREQNSLELKQTRKNSYLEILTTKHQKIMEEYVKTRHQYKQLILSKEDVGDEKNQKKLDLWMELMQKDQSQLKRIEEKIKQYYG